ncbi:regulatory protein ToxS [Photobacterium angustum]|uniref:ToxS n=1 Tax=Photobacterium angustum (strain S14 / CCUG 15956) TaxID=314292 RepID=Q1ZP72_PHOAS|nr:regulatory protein ToxS [Photobacterium angustum]EAS64088.1 ToxS [Photobacterium angustum S14]
MPVNSPITFSHFVRKYWPFGILAISITVCSWVYFSTDYKQEQLLMSREWQSTTFSRIEPTQLDNLGTLRKVKQNSNMVYLPNHTYSRITTLELYSEKPTPLTIHISESGQWDVSGGYLLTEPTEFKDVTSGTNIDFDDKQLNVVKDIFRMNAQESRRIDVINKNSLLLTSLTYGSNILYSL